jgi:hypothetical protein
VEGEVFVMELSEWHIGVSLRACRPAPSAACRAAQQEARGRGRLGGWRLGTVLLSRRQGAKGRLGGRRLGTHLHLTQTDMSAE